MTKHLCPICKDGLTCADLCSHASKWNDLTQKEKMLIQEELEN